MKGKTHDLNHDLTFSAHTINCVCHSIRSMFRVLCIYNFACILTYGLLDMGLVEIHGNKGHLTANKGGIFCRYTRICWYFCHAVAHNQAGKFCWNHPQFWERQNIASLPMFGSQKPPTLTQNSTFSQALFSFFRDEGQFSKMSH